MAFKQPGSGESFPTCVTLVVEAVCEHVHAQGGHAHVHLATNSTLLGRARGEAQVGLLVSVGIELPNKDRIDTPGLTHPPGQVAAGGVVLPALCALVLGLVHVVQTGRVLAAPVAGEEGLVGVGGGLAWIDVE